MAISKDEAIQKAKRDLAARLGLGEDQIGTPAVEDVDFPDMALGAPAEGEMSGQMITPGWRIRFEANKRKYEYRANKNQVRLFDYKGSNYRIDS